jgi:hypothetical protein
MMATARYMRPDNEATVERVVATIHQLKDVLRAARSFRGERGHPVVELDRCDSTSLSIGTFSDEMHSVVFYDGINGLSYHSVSAFESNGEPNGEPADVVIDHFGSWTEVPFGDFLPAPVVLEAAMRYLNGAQMKDLGIPFAQD